MKFKFRCARRFSIAVALLTAGIAVRAQENPPLRLVQTIPLPNVQGRFDHIDVDVKGKRFFVVGVESNSVEI